MKRSVVLRIDINKVKPPGNRENTDYQKIKESISKLGQIEPIIVEEKTFKIVDGLGRFNACKELKIPHIDVIIIEKPKVDELFLFKHGK